MTTPPKWDVSSIRKDFPILRQTIQGHPLAYLDNAATTQKPQCVLDEMQHYYLNHNANVHRGLHALSVRATEQYEAARTTIANYIGSMSSRECIFVRGTTEAINLVASAYLADRLSAEDEILITYLEHHSNIVPWQRLCEKTGAKLKVAPISESGEVALDAFANLLSSRTKLVAMTYASNAIGTINPVKTMVEMAQAVGAKVFLDAAQAMSHLRINVQHLGCDFLAFSGHKMFGPTGIGVLWGKSTLLEDMSPYQSGGEMIRRVTFEHTDYAPFPAKFEAGTPAIAEAIGLARAVQYLQTLNWDSLQAYEHQLLTYATEAVLSLKTFRMIGQARHKVPVVSFVHPQIHAHDVGTVLDTHGVAIRSGHHCAMPLMDFYRIPASNRISLSFYNTFDEIDQCIEALEETKAIFL